MPNYSQIHKDFIRFKHSVKDSSSSAIVPAVSAKRCKLFKFMETSQHATTPSSQTTPESPSPKSQVDKYLAMPCLGESDDPLQFWQKYSVTFPQLAELACQYLSVLASSA